MLTLLASYAMIIAAGITMGPPGIRATHEGAMKDTTSYFNDRSRKENDDGPEAMRKSGKTEIHVLSAEEKLAWKKALTKVRQEMGEKLGKPLPDSIYRETGMDPGKL